MAGGFVANFARGNTNNMYRGWSPNFTRELYEARNREVGALVNRGYDPLEAAESVYVARHPAIQSNDANLGVFNRIDEPLGPSQGITRARNEGQPIDSYGTDRAVPAFHASAKTSRVGGTVPNFEAQQKQMNHAVEAFGELGRAVESERNPYRRQNLRVKLKKFKAYPLSKRQIRMQM